MTFLTVFAAPFTHRLLHFTGVDPALTLHLWVEIRSALHAVVSWSSAAEFHKLDPTILYLTSWPCRCIQRKVCRLMQRSICWHSSQFPSLQGQVHDTVLKTLSRGSQHRTLLYEKNRHCNTNSADRPGRSSCIIKTTETLCAA